MNLFSERRISDHQSIGQTKKALGRRNRIGKTVLWITRNPRQTTMTLVKENAP